MMRALFSFMVLSSTFVGLASASPTMYTITIDTSSVAGTSGSLDFNFNPGPLNSQAASAQILNFSGGTLISTPTLTGDASGALPGSITMDNGTPFNDYFQRFTYGSTLTFQVSLFGPALSSPNGTATSGSDFAFSMFSNAAGATPILTTDTQDGFAILVNVNLDGSTTLTNYNTANTTPEPGTLAMLPFAVLGGALLYRRRQKYSQ